MTIVVWDTVASVVGGGGSVVYGGRSGGWSRVIVVGHVWEIL